MGADASGLELRCLAHYLHRYDKGDYAKIILEGDIHTHNQKAANLPTRNDAKTFIYAFLYGAGDELLGGGSRRKGAAYKKQFMTAIPALGKLNDVVKAKAKTHKQVRGLDGRPIPIRSSHSALNFLLQSCGAIVMKAAAICWYKRMKASCVPFGIMANVHDEIQVELQDEKDAKFAGEVFQKAMRDAQDWLGFNMVLDSEYKIGKNWADCH